MSSSARGFRVVSHLERASWCGAGGGGGGGGERHHMSWCTSPVTHRGLASRVPSLRLCGAAFNTCYGQRFHFYQPRSMGQSQVLSSFCLSY